VVAAARTDPAASPGPAASQARTGASWVAD